MRTGLRCAAVLVAAFAVPAVAPVPIVGPAVAGPCVRSVSIAAQRSAGEGAEKLVFTVFASGCRAAGQVSYEVRAGTAQPGHDFKAQTGLLRWAEGEDAARTITVGIVQDSDLEAEIEDFAVGLTEPSQNVRIIRATAQGRILDDDRPPQAPTFFVVDDGGCPEPTPSGYCPCPTGTPVPVWQPNEPNCVSPPFTANIPLPAPATIRWSTEDDTAEAGVDYVAVVDRIVSIPGGVTTVNLTVRVLPRPKGTPTRWFYLRVSMVSSGTIVDGTAVITLEGS